MRRIVSCAAAALAACSSVSTVDGTVAGGSLSVHSALVDTSSSSTLKVTLSSVDSLCADEQAGQKQGNSSSLTIWLGRAEAGLFANGTYTVVSEVSDVEDSSGQLAAAVIDDLASDCADTLAESASWATSGTVTVTQIDLGTNGGVEGTFDLLVGAQQDHITGTFNAGVCDLSAAPSSAEVCQ